MEDLEYYFSSDPAFFESIKTNTKRYLNFLYEIVDKILPRKTVKNSDDEIEPIEGVIQNQRMANLLANSNGHSNGNSSSQRQITKDQIPPELLRK